MFRVKKKGVKGVKPCQNCFCLFCLLDIQWKGKKIKTRQERVLNARMKEQLSEI